MREARALTLLCYDGSDGAKRAIVVSGQTLAIDKLVLLHLWHAPLDFVADSYGEPAASTGRTHAELEAEQIDRARATAEQGVELARAVGLDAEIELRPAHGDEWRVILDVAGALDASLIVLGTRGRTAVDDGLLGSSVSKGVLMHSLRPVLVVPPPPAP
jgi:nucleotide-binding universal stress UspA family protein